MDAAQALADLTEISSQIQAAVLFDELGTVVGSTLADGARSQQLVEAAAELVEAATEIAPGDGAPVQLEAATGEGSVFLVLAGPRRIVAVTGPEPTVGLVFYDLKSCLRGVAEEPAKPRRTQRRRSKPPAEKAGKAPAEKAGKPPAGKASAGKPPAGNAPAEKAGEPPAGKAPAEEDGDEA